MVERKRPAGALPLQHAVCENLILLFDDGLVLFGQGAGVVRRGDNRLHGESVKAKVQHGIDILHEVGVVVGKGTAHIVFAVSPLLDKPLEFGDNALPAAVAGVVHAVPIMNFLPAVQAQNHVVHLFVGEVNDIVVNEHAVGGQRKAEVFARILLNGAGIGHQLLDDVPVHEGLAAEEIHFQVVARAGVGDQIVQRLFAHLKGHESPFPVEFALAGKAIGTAEIAGMGHMETEGFDHVPGPLLKRVRQGLKGVLGEEFALTLQRGDVVETFLDILAGDLVAVFLLDDGNDFLGRVILVQGNHIVRGFADGVDGAGAGVQHNIVAVQLVLMNHKSCVSPSKFR